MFEIELFDILITIYTLSLIINSMLWIQKRKHLKRLIHLGEELLAGVQNELHIIKYIDGTIHIVGDLKENLPHTIRLNNEYENWISEVSNYSCNIRKLFYDSETIPLTMQDNIVELQKKHDLEIILTGISKSIHIVRNNTQQLSIKTMLSTVFNTFPNVLQHLGIPIFRLTKVINIISVCVLIYGACEKIVFPILSRII